MLPLIASASYSEAWELKRGNNGRVKAVGKIPIEAALETWLLEASKQCSDHFRSE